MRTHYPTTATGHTIREPAIACWTGTSFGLLYAGVHKDDRGVIAIDPNTGAIVEGQGYPAPNDIEGLTFCPLQPVSTPTSTDTPTTANTATPTSMATDTATSTETAMATSIQSPAAPTEIPTSTVTPMATNTATPTPTDSQPGSQSTPATPTPTATSTATPTVAPTPTLLAPTDLDETDEPGAPNATNLYLPLVVKWLAAKGSLVAALAGLLPGATWNNSWGKQNELWAFERTSGAAHKPVCGRA